MDSHSDIDESIQKHFSYIKPMYIELKNISQIYDMGFRFDIKIEIIELEHIVFECVIKYSNTFQITIRLRYRGKGLRFVTMIKYDNSLELKDNIKKSFKCIDKPDSVSEIIKSLDDFIQYE